MPAIAAEPSAPALAIVDPTPAVSAALRRSLAKRMASSLLSGGTHLQNVRHALTELRRHGYPKAQVDAVGMDALRIVCRFGRFARYSAHGLVTGLLIRVAFRIEIFTTTGLL